MIKILDDIAGWLYGLFGSTHTLSEPFNCKVDLNHLTSPWIYIEDKIPDYYEEIITLSSFGKKEVVCLPSYSKELCKGKGITHWFPMPEDPC